MRMDWRRELARVVGVAKGQEAEIRFEKTPRTSLFSALPRPAPFSLVFTPPLFFFFEIGAPSPVSTVCIGWAAGIGRRWRVVTPVPALIIARL